MHLTIVDFVVAGYFLWSDNKVGAVVEFLLLVGESAQLIIDVVIISVLLTAHHLDLPADLDTFHLRHHLLQLLNTGVLVLVEAFFDEMS